MEIGVIRKIIQNSTATNSAFQAEAIKGREYYENENDVILTGAAGINEVNAARKEQGKNPLHSADNRIPCNWHKVLTDQKVSYLFSYPPQFDVKSGMQYDKAGQKIKVDPMNDPNKKIVDAITKQLGGCYEKVIKQLGTDASNCGRAWLQYWYNAENGNKFEYWFINPTEITPIYDTKSAKKKLLYVLRQYAFTDDQGNQKTRYEVWTDKEVSFLELLAATPTCEHPLINFEVVDGNYNIVPHSYGRIPFIEFSNNEARKSDLTMYKKLIDSIDKLISGFANDIDDIQEIIWNIKNYTGEQTETVYDVDGKAIENNIDVRQKLKATGVLYTDDKGGLDVIRGEIPFEARSKFLEIATNQLYISAMAVNTNPDTAGTQSGVYIEFLYSLLELKAGLMQTEFMPALDQFIKAILQYLGLSTDTEVTQMWTRNKPRNETEISAIIAQTPNTVMSDETKTKVHPLVEDWQAEREKIEEETKQRQKDLIDSMGTEHIEPTTPAEPTQPEKSTEKQPAEVNNNGK